MNVSKGYALVEVEQLCCAQLQQAGIQAMGRMAGVIAARLAVEPFQIRLPPRLVRYGVCHSESRGNAFEVMSSVFALGSQTILFPYGVVV